MLHKCNFPDFATMFVIVNLTSQPNSVNDASLSELLLDEERTQMGELPGACAPQDSQLDEDPADDSAVGRLGLISELGFTFLHNGQRLEDS